jgi:hypothetical protein
MRQGPRPCIEAEPDSIRLTTLGDQTGAAIVPGDWAYDVPDPEPPPLPPPGLPQLRARPHNVPDPGPPPQPPPGRPPAPHGADPEQGPGPQPLAAALTGPHDTLSRLARPLTARERCTVDRWFSDDANASITYRDSTGHTATLYRENIAPLRTATAYLGGDILELLLSKLWLGDPPDQLPRIEAYAAGFHTALLSLPRDEPLNPRSRWAQLYMRIAPVLSKAAGAESADGHPGVCIPVHTTGHWVLVVLHLQTASFTVYNSISSPGHHQVETAIDTVKFRLGQIASMQGGHINWGATSWTAPTHLAQQYDVAAPGLAGGDCLLFVCCWTLAILSGDSPSLTTVRQTHMRNIRDQLLLMAVEGDETHSRRRPHAGGAHVIDLCTTDDTEGPPVRSDRGPKPRDAPLCPMVDMEQDAEGPPLTNKRSHAPCDHTQDEQMRLSQQKRAARRAECAQQVRHAQTVRQIQRGRHALQAHTAPQAQPALHGCQPQQELQAGHAAPPQGQPTLAVLPVLQTPQAPRADLVQQGRARWAQHTLPQGHAVPALKSHPNGSQGADTTNGSQGNGHDCTIEKKRDSPENGNGSRCQGEEAQPRTGCTRPTAGTEPQSRDAGGPSTQERLAGAEERLAGDGDQRTRGHRRGRDAGEGASGSASGDDGAPARCAQKPHPAATPGTPARPREATGAPAPAGQHQQDRAAQLTPQRLSPGPGGDPGSGGTAVAMQIADVTPALTRKRDTASVATLQLKTHRKKQALTSQQQGEADTPAPGRQQGMNSDTGGEQVRPPPQTAFNKSNSTADRKQGHDPYG